MDASVPTCPRHPDVETRLRCSACDTPICPACGREAAVGYKCPDCAAHDAAVVTPREGRAGGGFAGLRTPRPGADRARGRDGGTRPLASGDRLPTAVGARAAVVGVVAAFVGGLLLAPILTGGTFFLLSSGVIGWGVARAVFWASEEQSSPFLRAVALTTAGFSVAVGMALAGPAAALTGSGIAFLAYPAAMYGGWIVVRQR